MLIFYAITAKKSMFRFGTGLPKKYWQPGRSLVVAHVKFESPEQCHCKAKAEEASAQAHPAKEVSHG